MKTVSSTLAHGIPDGVSKKKKHDGWTVCARGDGEGFAICFRVATGVWRNRRIPRDEARTMPQAERWARANVDRLRAGEPSVAIVVPAVVRVRDLEKKFLEVRGAMDLSPSTLAQDEGVLRAHIIPRLGDKPAADVDVATLLEFVDALKKSGLGTSSIRNVLSVARCLFDVAKSRKLAPLTSNPTRDVEFVRASRQKRVRSAKPHLTVEAVEKVLLHPRVPEHWRLRILIACTGGLRDGEISGLTWAGVDLEGVVPVMHVTVGAWSSASAWARFATASASKASASARRPSASAFMLPSGGSTLAFS